MNFNISWGLDHIFVRVPISDPLLGRQVTDFLPTSSHQLAVTRVCPLSSMWQKAAEWREAALGERSARTWRSCLARSRNHVMVQNQAGNNPLRWDKCDSVPAPHGGKGNLLAPDSWNLNFLLIKIFQSNLLLLKSETFPRKSIRVQLLEIFILLLSSEMAGSVTPGSSKVCPTSSSPPPRRSLCPLRRSPSCSELSDLPTRSRSPSTR